MSDFQHMQRAVAKRIERARNEYRDVVDEYSNLLDAVTNPNTQMLIEEGIGSIRELIAANERAVGYLEEFDEINEYSWAFGGFEPWRHEFDTEDAPSIVAGRILERRDTTRNKQLYYELMSFCHAEDAPFCDPNCLVKVLRGRTVGMVLTEQRDYVGVQVTLSAKVPDTVIAMLDKRNMIHESAPSVFKPEVSIVCPKPAEE